MTAFEKVISAISSFNHPYKPDIYTGTAKRWFTYNYSDDYGADYKDNRPSCAIATVQVHYFCPANEDFVSKKNSIRKALHNVGFTFPTVSILLEKENNIRHITFECSIVEDIDG